MYRGAICDWRWSWEATAFPFDVVEADNETGLGIEKGIDSDTGEARRAELDEEADVAEGPASSGQFSPAGEDDEVSGGRDRLR